MIRLASMLCIAALLGACAAQNAPAGNSPAVLGAGLACFSVTLSASDGNNAPARSCDALCAARDAACVGVTEEDRGMVLPRPTCSDPPPSALVCRCCRVGS